jgi:hypothetical protein
VAGVPPAGMRDNFRMREAVGWPFVGPAVAVLFAFGEIGGRMMPPALDVAAWSFGSAAVLLTLKLAVWIATSHASFDRQSRLAAFVMLMAIGGGWYVADAWIHDRQFDYIVWAQNTELRLSATQLSASILAFVAERGRHAPPAPRPATWDEDQAAFVRYEADTVDAFEQRFGRPTRVAHDVLRQLGLRDRDLDVFYAHPANAFQIRIVGVKLGALAARVPG